VTIRRDGARRTWVMAAGSNCASKIAAKPLQMETRLLLTAYIALFNGTIGDFLQFTV